MNLLKKGIVVMVAVAALTAGARQGQSAPPVPYESYRGCGEYIVAGTVHSTPAGFFIVVNEKTKSEYTLKVRILEEPKLAPYVERPMTARVILDKPLDGTAGEVTAIHAVENRIPNPLYPAFDTGFRFIQKMNCRE